MKTVKVKDLMKGQSFRFSQGGQVWKVIQVAWKTWDDTQPIIQARATSGTTWTMSQGNKSYGRQVILVGCEWCGKLGPTSPITDPGDYQMVDLCPECEAQADEAHRAEMESEAQAERQAHLAFHFPGDYGPTAGPDPDDERERHLEDLYWDEARAHDPTDQPEEAGDVFHVLDESTQVDIWALLIDRAQGLGMLEDTMIGITHDGVEIIIMKTSDDPLVLVEVTDQVTSWVTS